MEKVKNICTWKKMKEYRNKLNRIAECENERHEGAQNRKFEILAKKIVNPSEKQRRGIPLFKSFERKTQ